MSQIQQQAESNQATEKKSNLSPSAQECMKRLPNLIAALRQSELVTKANQIMQQNPELSYEEVIDTVLEFDEVNGKCVNQVLTTGDTKGEIILNNYTRKCTAVIKKAGEYIRPAAEAEVSGNYVVEVVSIEPGRTLSVEEAVEEVSGYDRVESKMLLKNLPAIIDVGLEKVDADDIAGTLREAGATVNVEARD